jgi:hypothetical protein
LWKEPGNRGTRTGQCDHEAEESARRAVPEAQAKILDAEGPDPSENFREKTAVSQTGGAESGAFDAPNNRHSGSRPSHSDPELARVIDAWPTLPAPIKAGIVAMVQATGGASA